MAVISLFSVSASFFSKSARFFSIALVMSSDVFTEKLNACVAALCAACKPCSSLSSLSTNVFKLPSASRNFVSASARATYSRSWSFADIVLSCSSCASRSLRICWYCLSSASICAAYSLARATKGSVRAAKRANVGLTIPILERICCNASPAKKRSNSSGVLKMRPRSSSPHLLFSSS